MNGLNSCYKPDREYSLAPADDLLRSWRSKVKVAPWFKFDGKDIRINTGASMSIV